MRNVKRTKRKVNSIKRVKEEKVIKTSKTVKEKTNISFKIEKENTSTKNTITESAQTENTSTKNTITESVQTENTSIKKSMLENSHQQQKEQNDDKEYITVHQPGEKPKHAAIVLAAGKGERMQSRIPKQYMFVYDKPVLYYSLNAFQNNPNISEIVLVTRQQDIAYVKNKIVEKNNFTKVKKVISGGQERYDSVMQGLLNIEEADYVHIHDGARPMVNDEIINRCIQEVEKTGACVAGMPVKDTIKKVDNAQNVIETPERKTLWQVQTPQSFEKEMIKEAYLNVLEMAKDPSNNKLKQKITDDAMILETYNGKKIKLIEGSYKNIKITTPEDIEIAELFLKTNK